MGIDIFDNQEAGQLELEKKSFEEFNRSTGVIRALKTELEIAPSEGRSTEGILTRIEENQAAAQRARLVYESIPGSINAIRHKRVDFINSENDKAQSEKWIVSEKGADKIGRTAVRDLEPLLKELAGNLAYLRNCKTDFPSNAGLEKIIEKIPATVKAYFWQLVFDCEETYRADGKNRPPRRATFVPYRQVTEKQRLQNRILELEGLYFGAKDKDNIAFKAGGAESKNVDNLRAEIDGLKKQLAALDSEEK